MTYLVITLCLFVLIIFLIFVYALSKTTSKSHGILINGDTTLRLRTIDSDKCYECEVDFNKTLQCFIGKDDCVISNVILKDKKCIVGEIDSLLVSRKGLFCIEIKSTRGFGRGSDSALHWRFYQRPNSRAKTNVENPVMQNAKHCDFLEKTLEFQYISKNIVVFPNADHLNFIKSEKVFTMSEFINYFKSLKEDNLTREDISNIVDKLSDSISFSSGSEGKKLLTKEETRCIQMP